MPPIEFVDTGGATLHLEFKEDQSLDLVLSDADCVGIVLNPVQVKMLVKYLTAERG